MIEPQEKPRQANELRIVLKNGTTFTIDTDLIHWIEVDPPIKKPKWRLPIPLPKSILDLLHHTSVMICCLFSIWLIHFVLVSLLGSNAMFFDWIPIRWIMDIGDLGVIMKFLWEVLSDSRKGYKEKL